MIVEGEEDRQWATPAGTSQRKDTPVDHASGGYDHLLSEPDRCDPASAAAAAASIPPASGVYNTLYELEREGFQDEEVESIYSSLQESPDERGTIFPDCPDESEGSPEDYSDEREESPNDSNLDESTCISEGSFYKNLDEPLYKNPDENSDESTDENPDESMYENPYESIYENPDEPIYENPDKSIYENPESASDQESLYAEVNPEPKKLQCSNPPKHSSNAHDKPHPPISSVAESSSDVWTNRNISYEWHSFGH